MYVIGLYNGQRVAIFAAHVAAIEAVTANDSVVVMADGTRYKTPMQMELIAQGVMDVLSSAR